MEASAKKEAGGKKQLGLNKSVLQIFMSALLCCLRFKSKLGVDSYGNYYTSKYPYYTTRSKLNKELPWTDVYFRVMKETGGAVFNIKSFERKKMKIVSNLVARELLKQVKENARLCNKCLCTRDEVGVGKPVCKPVPSC